MLGGIILEKHGVGCPGECLFDSKSQGVDP